MKVLVADHDIHLRRLIVFMLESVFQAGIVEASSVRDGIEKLKGNLDVDCVISGFQPKEAGVFEIMQILETLNPQPPFLFCDFENEPEAIMVLQEKLKPIAAILKKTKDELIAPQFCKIPMDLVLKLGLLHCDLYIKISESKYVKNFRKGDRFDSFDFARYAAKNIDYLYLKPADAKRALTDLARNLQRVSDIESISTEEGVHLSAASLELISNFNQSLGFTEETRKLTQVSVELALKTIRESPTLSEMYSTFLYNPRNYLASHSTSLAYLSCGLASLLGWANESTFQKLTLAAFLHDLPLKTDALSRVPNQDELEARRGEFSEEERTLYLEHPQLAAGYLESMKDIDPEVAVILVQHHERPDGSGFPGQLTNAQ
ncbi:MAG: hypothetical protein H7333_08275, partial [Bdellovibrionales bacterium]|nr:hypothetical protein [Oligoflexia bacterium]